MSLLDWGWSSAWSERFLEFSRAGLLPARVAEGNRGIYELETAAGRRLAFDQQDLQSAAGLFESLEGTFDLVLGREVATHRIKRDRKG